MNRMHIINELEHLVNSQYVFLYKQKEKWINEFAFFKKIVNRFKTDSSFFFGIQDLLRSLEDPHFYMSYKHLTGTIPNMLPFWVKDSLYLSEGIAKHDLDYGKILKINDEPVDEIVKRYRNKYPETNSTTIKDLIAEDMMFGRFAFYRDMRIELDHNHRLFIYNINSDTIQRNYIETRNNNYINVISQSTRHNIRYIKIQSFNSTFDWAKVIMSIKEDQIIFDLRSNRGGNIRSAIDLVSHLIPSNLLISDYYVMSSYGERNVEILSKGNKSFADKMIVILVNEHTMGCAEYIFAYTLIKFMNAYTVGTPTLGIPGEGELYNISRNVLSITTTKYIGTQTGEIEHGLNPDYIVEPTIDDIINKRDVQLKFALNMLINSYQTNHYSQYFNVM